MNDIMTEEELVGFLRISEITDAEPKNVIANLKRMQGLPCMYISRKPLYPKEKIMEWVKTRTS